MFNEHVLREWQHPYHRGIPPAAEGGGASIVLGQQGFPGEGPYMQLALRVSGAEVTTAWFQTYACPVAIACGSRLARWVEGRSLDQVSAILVGELEILLGGLPPGKEHCSRLAIEALQSVLSQIGDEQSGG